MEIMLQEGSAIGTMKNGRPSGAAHDAENDAQYIRHQKQEMPPNQAIIIAERRFSRRSKRYRLLRRTEES